MATYSHATSKHATLTAATVDTVTITTDFSKYQVVNRGSDPIYMTYGETAPSDPTSAGDGTLVIPAGGVYDISSGQQPGQLVVKLISAGAAEYSVQGVDR